MTAATLENWRATSGSSRSTHSNRGHRSRFCNGRPVHCWTVVRQGQRKRPVGSSRRSPWRTWRLPRWKQLFADRLGPGSPGRRPGDALMASGDSGSRTDTRPRRTRRPYAL